MTLPRKGARDKARAAGRALANGTPFATHEDLRWLAYYERWQAEPVWLNAIRAVAWVAVLPRMAWRFFVVGWP